MPLVEDRTVVVIMGWQDHNFFEKGFMIDFNLDYFWPIILYAETHYKFKGIPSFLFKQEPEIIADAPFRIEPGQAIPVVVLVKDAHRYPIKLIEVRITLQTAQQSLRQQTFQLNTPIAAERLWHRLFYLEPLVDITGDLSIDVELIIEVAGQIKSYRNDNYHLSSHRPLKTYLASEPLPRERNWYWGDFHYHSHHTADQVEFGAPLEVAVAMAQALGLNFFAVTDHSYDLDDREDSWTDNDARLPKWHRLLTEVAQINQQCRNFVIIPGEEVSAGNRNHRNVHLLVLNNQQFFPGKGDSAERWLRTRPDLSIPQILNQLESGALAIAAHPEMGVPWLQWLLIRRGRWHRSDFAHENLHGYQLWNGEEDHSFQQQPDAWRKLLLTGKKIGLIAGNDAHGNFNRFRQIGFPFFTFAESESQLFGKMRTGVKVAPHFNLPQLIEAVKRCRTVISNGPMVDVQAQSLESHGAPAGIGDTIRSRHFELFINCQSPAEFGQLQSLVIHCGDLIEKQERVILAIDKFSQPHQFCVQHRVHPPTSVGYLWLDLQAQLPGGRTTRCLTSPLWFESSN